MTIMQGDSYPIQITLAANDGTPITSDQVLALRVTLGPITKEYPDGITYDDGVFYFPMSQEETFGLSGILDLKARIMTEEEEVDGVSLGKVFIIKSDDKEEIPGVIL